MLKLNDCKACINRPAVNFPIGFEVRCSICNKILQAGHHDEENDILKVPSLFSSDETTKEKDLDKETDSR